MDTLQSEMVWSDRAANRLWALWARRGRPFTSFVTEPEPRMIGSYARGRQLICGDILLSGCPVEPEAGTLWDIPAPNRAFEAECHGFSWLDDLAAVGDRAARELAQDWLWDWIARFGSGKGAGWAPELTGRRLLGWINHAVFLLQGQDDAGQRVFFRSLTQQSRVLARHWRRAPPGLPRLNALAGLLHAGLSLEGAGALADPALRALAEECDRQIDENGWLPSRNPEELLEVFVLLNWTASVLRGAGRDVPAGQVNAIEKIAPVLRTLRHADGALCRFHGGGKGAEGRLDAALAMSHVKPDGVERFAMGYARLSARRTSVVVDAGLPPTGADSGNAHASTLAFEMTSGRRPVIVNCGSGARFGEKWRRAGRATPSHSTLGIRGHSSARLAPQQAGAGSAPLGDGPVTVPVELSEDHEKITFQGGHDGYAKAFGLTHARLLDLRFDGHELAGEDLLLALDPAETAQLTHVLEHRAAQGIDFDIRLHLHPDVDARQDRTGDTIVLTLKSGEIWVFQLKDRYDLALEPSVYFDSACLEPRETSQIVVSGRVSGPATRVRWVLSRVQDTGLALRDLNRDDVQPVS